MKFNPNQLSQNRRRGLSSIVGALIFVVLMVSAFAVVGVALDSQTNIAATNRDVASKDLQKQKEDFSMDAFTDASNPPNLTVNVENLGPNPLEVLSLTVTDNSGNYNTTRYDIPASDSYVTTLDTKNILNSTSIKLQLPVAVNQTKVYSFKTISTLGNIAIDSVVCDTSGCSDPVVPEGEGSLSESLFLDGPNGINNKTSTIVMFVTNTSEETVLDVQPARGFDGSDSCNDGTFWTFDNSTVTIDNGFLEDVTDCTVVPNTPQDLGPHEIALFKWDVTIHGDIGAEFEFCNSVTGDDGTPPLVNSLPATCDQLTVIDPNDCDGCGPGGEGGEGGETIILIDDLLIRPSIFMTIPSPFGNVDNADTGLWAANIANPTDETMQISKVTILGYPPGGVAQFNVFEAEGNNGANNCNVEDIEPNTGPQPQGYWSCPTDNVLMWQSVDNPINLPANSTKSFVARVTPDNIKDANTHLDALIVQANVYSTFGSFGKAGYQSTMYSSESPIGNVYITTDTADINDRDVFISNVNDISNYTSTRFDVVLADMDTHSDSVIDPNARLIINIPREWEFINFISCDGFDDIEDGDCADGNMPSVTVHSDGSTQIIGVSQDEIGDGVNDARKIAFNARSAPVEVPRLYVMYILADGFATTSEGVQKSIGPLTEVVLNVDP